MREDKSPATLSLERALGGQVCSSMHLIPWRKLTELSRKKLKYQEDQVKWRDTVFLRRKHLNVRADTLSFPLGTCLELLPNTTELQG